MFFKTIKCSKQTNDTFRNVIRLRCWIMAKSNKCLKNKILVTSDDIYSQMVGQVPYNNSFEAKHSKNIHDANKKVIIRLNSFLDEIGI